MTVKALESDCVFFEWSDELFRSFYFFTDCIDVSLFAYDFTQLIV